jgi:hypothetical protein
MAIGYVLLFVGAALVSVFVIMGVGIAGVRSVKAR